MIRRLQTLWSYAETSRYEIDYQSIRNTEDLKTVAIPKKYLKETGNFFKYYTGEKSAPFLTVCIGGNHEASTYLRELYYGGWICPNIYYLGNSGVVNLCINDKILARVWGWSGIFKPYSFYEGSWIFIKRTVFCLWPKKTKETGIMCANWT